MDLEERAKRQSRRVLISEALMVITVIVTVLILAFVVSGYWLGADFKVERQGLLQISSFPTGADLLIDGEGAWLQRTNTSKVLPVGEHTLALTKEGYDTWSKTIEMKEGLLYRVGYPRLFLTERESADVWSLPENAEFVSVSPDQKLMLIATSGSVWQLLNLESEKVETKKVEIAKLFPDFVAEKTLSADATDTSLVDGLVSPAGEAKLANVTSDNTSSNEALDSSEPDLQEMAFTAQIVSGVWDQNNERILLKVEKDGATEWAILNVKNVALSVNLTREFSMDFERVEILNHSASLLLAVSQGNLRKIDVSGRALSSVLVAGVQDFDFLDETVVFATKSAVGLLNLSDNEPEFILQDLETSPRVLISRFYDDEFLTVVGEKKAETADTAVTSISGNRDDNANSKTSIVVYKKEDLIPFFEGTIDFRPEIVKVGYNGEFILLALQEKIATFDMEAIRVNQFSIDNALFSWFNRGMLYNISPAHELIVCDFDGLNRRVLAENVASTVSEAFRGTAGEPASDFSANSLLPAAISREKWLYYFDLNGNLVREVVAK